MVLEKNILLCATGCHPKLLSQGQILSPRGWGEIQSALWWLETYREAVKPQTHSKQYAECGLCDFVHEVGAGKRCGDAMEVQQTQLNDAHWVAKAKLRPDSTKST